MSATDYSLRINCHLCHSKHDLPLNHRGHYEGPAPCDSTKRLTIRVKSDEWRAMMEKCVAERVQ